MLSLFKKQNNTIEQPNIKSAIQPAINNLIDTASKVYKQKYEYRQKNLRCPADAYHMKVHFKDLLEARPTCPKCGSPMLLKEEMKEVNTGHIKIESVVEESDIKAYLV